MNAIPSVRNCVLALAAFTLATLHSSPAHAAGAGALDTSFDPGTGPNTLGSINAAIAQTDGKVIAAGYFTNFNGVTHPGIVRLNSNGSVDTAFNHGSGFNVSGTVALVLCTAIQDDGKILVGGGFSTYDGAPALGLIRLNTDGTVDSGFSQPNSQLIANSLRVLDNGKILVGLTGSPGLVRLNSNGSIDSSFFLQFLGPSLNDAVKTISVQGDGKILVSGKFSKHYTGISDTVGVTRQSIARLNADGTLDPSFDAGAGPSGGNGAVFDHALQNDGKIIVAGDFMSFSGVTRGSILRLNSNGSMDTSFASDPGTTTSIIIGGVPIITMTGPIFDVALDSAGRVIAAGNFTKYNGTSRNNLIRLSTAGALDTTFDSGTPNLWTSTLSLQADGKMIVSGFFTSVGGVPRAGLARLHGTPVAAVAPTISSQPANQSVTLTGEDPGPTVSFSVGASGSDPLTYQWLHNNVPLGDGLMAASVPSFSGAHTATLTISNVTGRNAGKYSCIVSNSTGKVTSASASLLVNSFLTLTIEGTGIVRGATNGQALEVNRSYTLTAVPGKDQVFSQWTGDVSSRNPVLSFTMTPGLSVTARFVPNPFLPWVGAYNGLFYEPSGGVRHGASGFCSLALSPAGSFSAKLQQGTKTYRFTGAFDADGHAAASVKRPGTNDLSLQLTLDLHGAEQLTGEVTDGSWVATLNADRAVFNAKSAPATNFARSYTLLIAGSTNSPAEPAGDSPGSLIVDNGGSAKFAGVLADGSPATQKVPISKAGAWPLYVSLYRGQGSMLGWITITNSPEPDLGGIVSWSRPAGPAPKVHTNGFALNSNLTGSGYRAPGTNTLLGLTSATVSFTEGNLPENFSDALTLLPKAKVVATGTNKLTLTLVQKTGQFAGKVTPPETLKPVSFKGAILQKQGYGGGFFLGTNASGQVRLSP